MLRSYAQWTLRTRGGRSIWASRCVSLRYSSSSSKSPPLFQLRDAIFKDLHESSSPLSLTINDDHSEIWAIVAPRSSSSSGSKLLLRLSSALTASSRPQQLQSDQSTKLHPSPHLFTSNHRCIALASFSKQQVNSSSEFQDFSARYGALREEDTITVFETLMDAQGFEVGKIAAMKVLPDKLLSTEVDQCEKSDAKRAKERIEIIASLLGLQKPGPGSEGGLPLLYSPVISLSNGQLRRARIVSSLVRLEEAANSHSEQRSLLVLDQPYSGLDESSRIELTQLIKKLHESGSPRIILILRRQDEVPSVVTHIVDIDTEGKVWIGSKTQWQSDGSDTAKGVEGIRANREKGVGVGQGKKLIRLAGVSVQYVDKIVLDNISMTLNEGSRLIIKGSNGSGKTTLLSLLNGTHPQSYSFSSEQYTLFGKPRIAPSNATRLLSQRIGYFGPDLLASFPRRGKETGGLSIKEAVACGFAGVFSKVHLDQEQTNTVEMLLNHFKDCLAYRDQGHRAQKESDNWWDKSFIELDGGSQAVVLFLRAIVNRPAIVILDEPFQGMDALQIDRLRTFIDSLGEKGSFCIGNTDEAQRLDLEKAAKTAVVLVSHYINEWPDTMGQYMLLDNGRIVDQI